MDPPDNILVEHVPDVPVVPAGNTKTAGLNSLYRWAFTLKSAYCGQDGIDVPIAPRELAKILEEFCKEYYFQLEVGEGGFEHFQGCFSLKIKHRMSEVKNILGFNTIHLEPIRNWAASKRYVQKTDTRIAGPWDHKTIHIEFILQLNWWQNAVEEIIIEKPDYRTIYWIWDQKGNVGKSAFSKYCAIKHGATVVNNGSFSDLAYVIPEQPKLVIFDLPRTVEGRVNYSAIEAIKNGLIFSAKYESRTKIFNPPHVIIFANFKPDEEAMSKDRWQIIEL